MTARKQKLLPAAGNRHSGLAAALARLDRHLAEALPVIERGFRAAGALEQLRGIQIHAADALAAIDGAPTRLPVMPCEEIAALLAGDRDFANLGHQHALGAFEAVVLLLALAPEFDLRYQRVFAFLQDDVARKRPTLDLILALTCADAAERHARLAAFSDDAPLRREGLIELVTDPNYCAPPMLAQFVKPGDAVIHAMLGGVTLNKARPADGGGDPASAACRIEARATWEDIVLSADVLQQLHEICERVSHRNKVLERWGFARKLVRCRGTAVLFAGGSGTGKTMAAEVIANALGLDLYRIDLARVVSKYIGDTEKNLERVFAAAAGREAILLFDEADALFGKRSEVKDARDRYANIEVSYLLQKMEEYEGVAILTTNLADNLDMAFTRRLAFQVQFPFPDEESRQRIWERVWPAQAPLGDSVNFAMLARELKLCGGAIRNVAIGAAYLAASDDSVVSLEHVCRAARREQQKRGQTPQRISLTAGAYA